jgi:hypothetical protein
MKKALHLCKFFLACLFSLYSLPSCRTTSITIRNGDSTTQKLDLRDAEGRPADTVDVVPGERIKWIITDGSNVDSIKAISEKDTSQNVLGRRAHSKRSSSTWKAKVARKAQLEKIAKPTKAEGKEYYYEEQYYIEWKDKSGNIHTYDPKIAVNPK